MGQPALSMAISIAQREHGTIVFVGVSPGLALQTALDANAGVSPRQVRADADAAVQASLDTALAQVPPEIGARSILRRGKVGPSIVDVPDQRNYDAILLGARALGRIGSAAEA
jgi:nucleotide-binding universal stress UspA family protein